MLGTGSQAAPYVMDDASQLPVNDDHLYRDPEYSWDDYIQGMTQRIRKISGVQRSLKRGVPDGSARRAPQYASPMDDSTEKRAD